MPLLLVQELTIEREKSPRPGMRLLSHSDDHPSWSESNTSIPMSDSTSSDQAPVLNLSYNLVIPESHSHLTSSSSPPPSEQLKIQLDSTAGNDDPIGHLIALERALGEARDWMNGRMTAWRSRLAGVPSEQKLGKPGTGKKRRKGKKNGAGDEDEVDDEDEDAEDEDDDE